MFIFNCVNTSVNLFIDGSLNVFELRHSGKQLYSQFAAVYSKYIVSDCLADLCEFDAEAEIKSIFDCLSNISDSEEEKLKEYAELKHYTEQNEIVGILIEIVKRKNHKNFLKFIKGSMCETSTSSQLTNYVHVVNDLYKVISKYNSALQLIKTQRISSDDKNIVDTVHVFCQIVESQMINCENHRHYVLSVDECDNCREICSHKNLQHILLDFLKQKSKKNDSFKLFVAKYLQLKNTFEMFKNVKDDVLYVYSK